MPRALRTLGRRDRFEFAVQLRPGFGPASALRATACGLFELRFGRQVLDYQATIDQSQVPTIPTEMGKVADPAKAATNHGGPSPATTGLTTNELDHLTHARKVEPSARI